MKHNRIKWLLLAFPFSQGLCISSKFVKNCKEELSLIASYAHHVNSQVEPKFVRSRNYVSLNSDPTDFWIQSRDNPSVLKSATEYRIEHLKGIHSKYEETLLKLESKSEITAELAKQIVILESDPILNSVLDEYTVIPTFEKHLLPNLNEEAKNSFEKNLSNFKQASQPIIESRRRLKEKLYLGNLSIAETKLLLEKWLIFHNETDLHPDSLPDWITGADASLKASNKYLDPESGHQTGYGASPLKILEKSLKEIPLNKGDSILDVGSGWGRILISGAVLYPELNFSGVEFVQERVTALNHSLKKMKLPNAQNKQMDASEAEIESEIKKAKAIFLFNSFSPPALKLFIERTKSVVKITQQTKYIIAANEHLFPISLEKMGLKAVQRTQKHEGDFNQYTIYKLVP